MRPMTVFEALMFAVAFATLVIGILSFNQKK
ncbi:putative holin-like toxin [Thalassobacillus devorans]